MSLVILNLSYDSGTSEKAVVQLEKPVIAPQRVKLCSYSITLNSADANLTKLYVELPFMNSRQSILTNNTRKAIPLHNDTTSKNTFGKLDYELVLYDHMSKKIKNWYVYDQEGTVYDSQDYTIELVFNVGKVG